MNILVTTPSFSGKGGVSNYYRIILPFLNDSLDIRISHMEVGGINSSNKLHPLNDQIRVYRQIAKDRINLIHVNPSLDPKSLIRDGMFTFLAKKRKIPVLVFFRGWHMPFEPLFEGKLKYFSKKILQNADSFIVLSDDFKQKLKKWGVNVPVYTETTIVDDGFLSDFSIQKRVEFLRNMKKVKILFLARLEKEKGIFETIDAVSILLSRGHSVSLSIAGDGTAMREVIQSIERHDLKPGQVELLGYIQGEKKKAALESHHIYCFPSYGEGMPNSVLEAMAFGMPVITSPVGGLKDFFENDRMGYFIDKRNPTKIAIFLEKLIRNREKMVDMAIYNHAYARKHFLASKVASRIKKIYRKTITLYNE